VGVSGPVVFLCFSCLSWSRIRPARDRPRVSAIERAKVDASELRTLAAYVKALGGRLEIVADVGGERLVIG
jgi:hypothetical protein